MYDLEVSDSNGNTFFISEKYQGLNLEVASLFKTYQIQDHVFFLSSGTTSAQIKGYAVAKKAMIANAKAVNEHLNLSVGERWGLTLPPFHVGGISIFFRSILLQTTSHDLLPWNPHNLAIEIETHKISAISLVPTQIYDLVHNQIKAPSGLKVALAGGDFLSEALEEEALRLGWPLYRTFGMSEVSSQLATVKQSGSRELNILPLHQVKTDAHQKIWVKSSSLFSFEFCFNQSWKCTKASDSFDEDGFYPLPDKGRLEGSQLTPLGRDDSHFKTSGRLVDLNQLKNALESCMLKNDTWGTMELMLKNDERKGKILCLISEGSVSDKIKSEFLSSINPVKIDEFLTVNKIERTELGKFKQSSIY